MSLVMDIRTNIFYFHMYLENSSMTECESILNRIIDGDSDIDLSEDETEERRVETGVVGANEDEDTDEDESDEDAEPEKVDQDTVPAQVRRPLWARTNT